MLQPWGIWRAIRAEPPSKSIEPSPATAWFIMFSGNHPSIVPHPWTPQKAPQGSRMSLPTLWRWSHPPPKRSAPGNLRRRLLASCAWDPMGLVLRPGHYGEWKAMSNLPETSGTHGSILPKVFCPWDTHSANWCCGIIGRVTILGSCSKLDSGKTMLRLWISEMSEALFKGKMGNKSLESGHIKSMYWEASGRGQIPSPRKPCRRNHGSKIWGPWLSRLYLMQRRNFTIIYIYIYVYIYMYVYIFIFTISNT